MKTEQYIEKLISEGKIKREELEELIARESAKNPIPALDAKVTQMEQDQGDLFMELILMGVI